MWATLLHAAFIFRVIVAGWWLSFCVCMGLYKNNPGSKEQRLVDQESIDPLKGH
jgi:hypothetical protein